MTARVGILQKFQAWIMGMSRPAEPAAVESQEKPLIKLQRMIMAMATPDGRRGGGLHVMIDAVNEEQITCKSKEFLKEGERLELAMLLQGVGHVTIPVTVEWVLLSSFGHSAGLHIEQNEHTQQIMAAYVALIRANSRG